MKNLKTIFALMAMSLFSLTAYASTASDLVPISKNWVFIADDITSNGTANLVAGTLYAGDRIFAPTNNTAQSGRGSSNIGGVNHLNSLRIKNAQDRLAFAVADSCTVIFYTQNHAERGLYISNIDNNTTEENALFKQPVSTPVWEVKLPAAGTYYLTSYGSDFYIAGFEVKFAIKGRTFTDFKIEFRTNPYTVLLPDGGVLPDGVFVAGTTYNGSQHGVQNGTITVPVDGAVKFTIGACKYGNHTVTIKKNGEAYDVVDNNFTGTCGEQTGVFTNYGTWTYNSSEAATLTFELNGYMPFFFAEAVEVATEVTVNYYDVDGSTLIGSDVVNGGSDLVYKYSASDVSVADGKAFKGWYNGPGTNAAKVAEGTIINEDIDLYAHVRDIEVAEVGKTFYYDLTDANFDQSEHEVLTITGGSYYNTHGWKFGQNATIAIEVAGDALVQFKLCQYGNEGTLSCVDGNSNPVGEAISLPVAVDGNFGIFRYSGDATTLTFTLPNGSYVHSIKAFNVAQLPVKNEAGMYVVGAGDESDLLLMLETASNGDIIFLPNGTYDLGTRTLTEINTSISLIGQSMNGVLIVNHPQSAGMNNAETLHLRAENIYLQDLAVRCDVSYPGSAVNGVGIAVQDRGNKTIYKRVDLQGNQDTYLSSYGATQRCYFADCRLEGTVDYVCGGGDIWFENTLFYNNGRSGADVIIAPNTAQETVYGYVLNNCTIDGADNQANIWHLARGWQRNPAATFLNTTCKIAPASQGYIDMSAGLVVRFHEYNTRMEDGTPITGHSLDGLGYDASSDAIYLENEGIYTYENVVKGNDNWDAAAIAEQEVADIADIDDDAAYLIEDNGAYVDILKGSSLNTDDYKGKTIRKANDRGGFGDAVLIPSTATAVEQTDINAKASKILRNGILLIEKNGKLYTAQGVEVR